MLNLPRDAELPARAKRTEQCVHADDVWLCPGSEEGRQQLLTRWGATARGRSPNYSAGIGLTQKMHEPQHAPGMSLLTCPGILWIL